MSEADWVAGLPGAQTELAPGLDVAMLRFAARYEYARSVEDMLARRSRLLFLDARLAQQLVPAVRSEEHTSELQSLMRNSYAVICLKKKKKQQNKQRQAQRI